MTNCSAITSLLAFSAKLKCHIRMLKRKKKNTKKYIVWLKINLMHENHLHVFENIYRNTIWQQRDIYDDCMKTGQVTERVSTSLDVSLRCPILELLLTIFQWKTASEDWTKNKSRNHVINKRKKIQLNKEDTKLTASQQQLLNKVKISRLNITYSIFHVIFNQMLYFTCKLGQFWRIPYKCFVNKIN